MLRRALIIMSLVIPLGLSGCDTAYIAAMDKMGYAKRDILSSRVKSARDAQEEAKKDIQSALEKFGKVVAYQGAEAAPARHPGPSRCCWSPSGKAQAAGGWGAVGKAGAATA